ncbi:hypothetical protein DYB28_000431, partial [Aphanomyces astaci]
TADHHPHYMPQDFSASIDATPMPRYLGRYSEGDINVGLNRPLPRGDLGRSQVRLDLPTAPFRVIAPTADSPPSSPMSGRHPHLPAAPASPGSASASLRPAEDVDMAAPPTAEQSYSNAVVWGTNVNVADSMRVFRTFLHEFVPAQLAGADESYYRKVLRQIQLTQDGVFNLDCQHLLHFQDDTKARIQVRPFNLKEVQAMRNLNPSDIDQLVSLQGMITRCSAVIPDLKMAFFRCTTCHTDVQVELDRGRIDEPSVCVI